MLKMRTSQQAASIASQVVEAQTEAVLVCVTRQQSCRNLIRRGASIAKEKGLKLLVLSVQPKQSIGTMGSDVLEQLFVTASEYGAEMSVYYCDDPNGMTDAYIRRNHIAVCVTGLPTSRDEYVAKIRENHPGIQLLAAEDMADDWNDIKCG